MSPIGEGRLGMPEGGCRAKVSHRFDRAATTYDSATPVQHAVADLLAGQVAYLPLPSRPRVAEFGCGTGYLAECLAPALNPRLWIASDLAPAMVALTTRRLSRPEVVTAVMDATRPAIAGPYDLVCSSMALHWLASPREVVAKWRALAQPGGWLAVACPVDGTFEEWRRALKHVGVERPKPAFPNLNDLWSWFSPSAAIETVELTEDFEDGLTFARALRSAGVDTTFTQALDGGTMRRALAAFERGGSRITYRVALILEPVFANRSAPPRVAHKEFALDPS